MKLKLLFILLITNICIAYGNTDSVRHYLNNAEELKKTNIKQALIETEKAINEAAIIEDKKSLGDAYNLKGNLLKGIGKFDTAFIALKQALKIRKSLDNICDIGSTYNNLSSLKLDSGKLGEALLYIDSALVSLEKKCKEKVILAQTYINKGRIFYELEELNKATQLYQEANNILSNLDNQSNTIAIVNENLAAIYYDSNNLFQAIQYYLKSHKIYVENKDTTSLAQICNSIGVVYFEMNQFRKAEAYFNQSIQYATQVGNKLLLIDALINLGDLQLHKKNYKAAKEVQSRVESVIENAGGLKEKLSLSQLSVDIYDLLERYKEKAYFQEIVMSLQDSIYTEKESKLMAEELAKLESAEKEAQIATKNAENQRQRFYMAALACLCLSLIAVVLFFKRKADVKQRKHELYLNKEQEMIRESIIEASFQIRNEIHKNLHDKVSNPLSNASIYLESAIGANSNSADLNKAFKIVDDIYDVSRNIAYDLLPYKIDWIDRINLSLEALERSKSIHTSIDLKKKHIDRLTFSPEKGERVAAIIGNLIVNVEKHSKAKNVAVAIQKEDNKIAINVIDDGVGFDKTRKRGIGLKSIQSNVKKLNGIFEIISIKGKGTTAKVLIPLT